MAFSAGVYTLPGAALSTGDTVSATDHNQVRNDMATAFNLTWLRNGTATATANIPMGGFKLTGLAAATTAGDAVRYEQFASPPAIGGTAAAAGAFTTLTSSSDSTLNGLTVGKGAGSVATNTAVGASALAANTSGDNNVGIGYGALQANTTGPRNVGVGRNALNAVTTNGDNVAVGHATLELNTGSSNTALGSQALKANTTASNATAVGYQAGYSNVTGTKFTAVGFQAGYANTANNLTALGYAAAAANTTGGQNTAIGSEALTANTTGTNNVAVGTGALVTNTTGSQNTAIGKDALVSNTVATQNTAVGYQALYSLNRTADSNGDNTAVGNGAGYGVTTGYRNTLVGLSAGYYSNTLTTGYQNVLIGAQVSIAAGGDNNSIVIGTPNTMGKGSSTAYISAGGGSTYNGANTTTWATTSDQRIKKNVVDVTGALEKVVALRPVEFDYKENDKHEVGFIAQEFQQVLPDQIVTHAPNEAEKEWVGDEDVLAIQQNLVPYLVAAIKELKAEIDLLKGN